MGENVITFGDNKIEKQKFQSYKYLIFIKHGHIDNILISNSVSSGAKSYK